jgi:hypothetical protein
MVTTSQDGKLIVWDAFTTNKEVYIFIMKTKMNFLFLSMLLQLQLHGY